MYRPVRIRAYLRTGVVSDQFLPLDAVLYYHFTRMVHGEKIISKPGESNVRQGTGLNLPFKKGGSLKEGNEGAWFYHCSFAQWPQFVHEAQSFKTKKGDWLANTEYLRDKVKRVVTERGKFKGYQLKFQYRHAQYVEWYAVANVPELLILLQFCTNLGANGGDGWGAVQRWEVDDWPEDWSVRGPGNKLMRAVPAQNGIPYGIRPSYWNERHIMPCLLPR